MCNLIDQYLQSNFSRPQMTDFQCQFVQYWNSRDFFCAEKMASQLLYVVASLLAKSTVNRKFREKSVKFREMAAEFMPEFDDGK